MRSAIAPMRRVASDARISMTIHAVTDLDDDARAARNAAGDDPGHRLDEAEDADQAPDRPDRARC